MNFSIFLPLSYEETFFSCQNPSVLLLILGIVTAEISCAPASSRNLGSFCNVECCSLEVNCSFIEVAYFTPSMNKDSMPYVLP